MRSNIFRIILTATAVLTAACSSADAVAPTTSASVSRTISADITGAVTMRQPVDKYVWLSCLNDGAGETVHVTGEMRYRVESTKDATGVYHLNIKSSTANLTGMGLTSGTLFLGLTAERVNSRAEDELNMDVRITDIIKFVASGSRVSYSLMATTHVIVDQGTYVLWNESWNEVCR
jgi:hypothetical protein